MAKSTLFRWEDSPSLRHHCGFCNRPLSHPGAKQSCLGVHSEPCSRFHQALFMRNRSHQCASCIGTDQAHHKRHSEIAISLRDLYDSCGRNIPLIPDEIRKDGEHQVRPPEDNVEGVAGNNTRLSKRERKDAKRLVKAASRPKVITNEDVGYIGSVLHPVHGVPDDAKGPSNPQEVEEIEHNLRYNAHVYQHGTKPSTIIKGFAHLQDTELDFDGEMERILNKFSVNNLIKSNVKNQGLHGKALKDFDTLVKDFKALVVEDLVLVKKEEMETRMRRAAYLRYANRTSFDILVDRHTQIDWKTGARIVRTESPDEEGNGDFDEEGSQNVNNENSRPYQGPASYDMDRHDPKFDPARPDLRHLANDKSPERPLTPASRKPATSENVPFKILSIVTPNSKMQANGNDSPNGHGWATVGKGTKSPEFLSTTPLKPKSIKKNATIPPARKSIASRSSSGSTLTDRSYAAVAMNKSDSVTAIPSPMASNIPKNTAFLDFATVAPPSLTYAKSIPTTKAILKSPPRSEIDEGTEQGHPPISQKKMKKSKRNAVWKARKQAALGAGSTRAPKETEKDCADTLAGEHISDIGKEDVMDQDVEQQNAGTDDLLSVGLAEPVAFNVLSTDSGGLSPHSELHSLWNLAPNRGGTASKKRDEENSELENHHQRILPSTRLNHNTWTAFTNHLAIDCLTQPLVLPDNCLRIDCPLHDIPLPPSPLTERTYLVCPSTISTFISGPFNRIRGAKLLAHLSGLPETKNRLMLVDHNMLEWLTTQKHHKRPTPPAELVEEWRRYDNMERSGRLMHMELDFNALRTHNAAKEAAGNHISEATLQKLCFGLEGCRDRVTWYGQLGDGVCYCLSKTQEEGDDMIECAYKDCVVGKFHRECVKDWCPELVSKWYCCECREKMTKLARKMEVDCGLKKGGAELGKE